MRTKSNGRWLMLGAILLLAVVAFFAVIDITHAGAPDQLHFFGVVQTMPASGTTGDWTVRGGFMPRPPVSVTVTVHVTTTTEIDQSFGAAQVGAYVEVTGRPRPDGSIDATEIKVLPNPGSGTPIKFFGVVETLPASGLIGDWSVRVGPSESLGDNHSPTSAVTRTVTVHVSSATQIDQTAGAVKVGAFVKVDGLALPDKTVNAIAIEVKTPPPPPNVPVEFFGKIDQLPTSGLVGDWIINGRTVHVSATTKIEHPELAKVGAFVHVSGFALTDGSVNARAIEVRNSAPPPVKYIKFYGLVQQLPTTTGWIGDWKVNGLTVHVTATTVIRQTSGAPAVGKPVEVKGILQADGSVNALWIETKRASTTNPSFGKADAVAQPSK